jgi:hypothetical protein
MLMNILFFFFQTCSVIRFIFEISAQVVDYISHLSWLLLIIHRIRFLFSILLKSS